MKTETIIQYRTTAAIPPEYLCMAEPVPTVPDGVPADERTDYLLEAYASRGDALKRALTRHQLFLQWRDEVIRIYPGSVEHPLPDLETKPDNPQNPSE